MDEKDPGAQESRETARHQYPFPSNRTLPPKHAEQEDEVSKRENHAAKSQRLERHDERSEPHRELRKEIVEGHRKREMKTMNKQGAIQVKTASLK